MRKIYKYELTNLPEECEVEIHDNWNFCDAAFQNGKLCVWAVVNLENPLSKFKFVVYATGQDLPQDDLRRIYLKTVHDAQGYVWHVFAVLAPLPPETEKQQEAA